MKKTTLLSALTLSFAITASAFAADQTNNSGFYVGFGLGVSKIAKGLFAQQEGKTKFIDTESNRISLKEKGFAGREFVGYMFNQYAGLEMGATQLHKATANYVTNFDAVPYQYQVTENTYDILGVARSPAFGGFSVFGKLGFAYVDSKYSIDSGDIRLGQIDFRNVSGSTHARAIVPAFALGTSYQVTNHIGVDLQWMRIEGKKNAYVYDKLVVGNLKKADLYTAGMTYSF